MAERSLAVYLHIPFCVRKCLYCDFLSFPSTEEAREVYVQALLSEIDREACKYSGHRVKTVFIGGGTPSILSAEQIKRILDQLRKCFRMEENAEITMEANPGTLDGTKLAALRRAGINRLSMGLQSANDKELELLGRIHRFDDFLNNYYEARTAGFRNINVDLMSALPGQSLEAWESTLRTIADLQPEHISAYSLIIEEGTPFYERYGNGHEDFLPDEETDRAMYHRTAEILQEYGYHRYEISNYARSGFESRHNCTYWERGDYVGFGLGASSLIGNRRFQNPSDMKNYLECFGAGESSIDYDINTEDPDRYREITDLSEKECMSEALFLGLRLIDGVSIAGFRERYGQDLMEVFRAAIEKHQAEGLLMLEEDRLRLTELGLDLSNYVMCDFLLD